MPGSDRNTDALAEPLAAIMREAGALALRTFKSQSLKTWTKDASSPVSEADIAVDRFLHERLVSLTPGAWLSEEAVDDPARMSSDRVWIVDPIDGTRAYIAGLADWTISVALAERGRPVVAALFAPVTEELFLATAGAGARLNGRTISASPGDALEKARFAGPQRYLDWITGIETNVVAVPKIHSLALRLARVAQGAVDAAFTAGNSHDWDLAAADLLVHEAGGALTDFAGKPLVYNSSRPVHGALLAAGRVRHATLVELARGRDTDR